MKDTIHVTGRLVAVVTDASGEERVHESKNCITEQGCRYYIERSAGIKPSSFVDEHGNLAHGGRS